MIAPLFCPRLTLTQGSTPTRVRGWSLCLLRAPPAQTLLSVSWAFASPFWLPAAKSGGSYGHTPLASLRLLAPLSLGERGDYSEDFVCESGLAKYNFVLAVAIVDC